MLKIPAPKTHIVLICAGLFCFLTAFVLLHSFQGKFVQDDVSGLPEMEDTIDLSVPATTPRAGKGPVSSAQDTAETNWVIYITGHVTNPGVYEIAAGSRVYQALEAAGGFAADADREGINLAAPLQDGVHIHFPGKNERETRPAQPQTVLPLEQAHTAALGTSKSSAVVNLNTCSAEELTSLPGIGPKTAELILAYRKSNGRFARIEDLLLIKGIGPKKYDAIRNLIIVEQT